MADQVQHVVIEEVDKERDTNTAEIIDKCINNEQGTKENEEIELIKEREKEIIMQRYTITETIRHFLIDVYDDARGYLKYMIQDIQSIAISVIDIIRILITMLYNKSIYYMYMIYFNARSYIRKYILRRKRSHKYSSREQSSDENEYEEII